MPHPETFTLTADHLKLVRAMYFNYDPDTEHGAPEVNPKRPYGNSDVYDDMRDILGVKSLRKSQLDILHKETATVLQLMVQNCELPLGEYVQNRHSKWDKVAYAAPKHVAVDE